MTWNSKSEYSVAARHLLRAIQIESTYQFSWGICSSNKGVPDSQPFDDYQQRILATAGFKITRQNLAAWQT